MLIVLSLKHSPWQVKQKIFCEGFIHWFHFRTAKGAVGASPYQNAAEIQEWRSENQVMPLGSLQVVSCLKKKTPSSQHSAPTPYFPSLLLTNSVARVSKLHSSLPALICKKL